MFPAKAIGASAMSSTLGIRHFIGLLQDVRAVRRRSDPLAPIPSSALQSCEDVVL